jgi:transglutaminase-like putative cysteine protease
VVNAWFDAITERLRIISSFEVETLRQNPFEYLLSLGAERLPVRYDEGLEAVLAGYCTRQYEDGAVAAFAHGIAADCGSRTLEFLAALNARIQETCPGIIREEGWAHPPEHTLRLRTGSCRDVAVAASRESRHATPIEGAFQGGGARSTVEAHIELQ